MAAMTQEEYIVDEASPEVFEDSPFATVDGGRIRRLLSEHLGGIARYLGRLGIPASEVDDVAQEVFVVAASKLAGIPSGSDRRFLYAIASRVANNARRADTRRRRAYERYLDLGRDPVPTQEELSDQLRARTLFDSVLREMTPELRGVFLLCEVEGLAVPEIARRLALPTGTAASRLRRARETFFDRIARARLRQSANAQSDEGPEIMSWWVSDGEVDALRALLDIYRRSHPGISVVHGGIRDTTNAKFRMVARMSEGDPARYVPGERRAGLAPVGARSRRRLARAARVSLSRRELALRVPVRRARPRDLGRRSVCGAAQHSSDEHPRVRRRGLHQGFDRPAADARRALQRRRGAPPRRDQASRAGHPPALDAQSPRLRELARRPRRAALLFRVLPGPALATLPRSARGDRGAWPPPRPEQSRRRSPRLGRGGRSRADRRRGDDDRGRLDEGVPRA